MLDSDATFIRPAAVAGMFYPASPRELRAAVAAMLDTPPPRSEGTVKALIAPHAGYVYSGQTAARAYAAWQTDRQSIRRIVIVAPAHRAYVPDMALSSASAFSTPLGDVPVDTEARDALGRLGIPIIDAAHAKEHAIEVHLPFLQTLLPRFSIVPIVVGGAHPAQVADALDHVWGDDSTRILISSDLSHYLPYEVGKQMDERTVDAIVTGHGPIASERACGSTGINALMLLASKKGLRARPIDRKSSGDTAGRRDEVVGYASIAFEEPLAS